MIEGTGNWGEKNLYIMIWQVASARAHNKRGRDLPHWAGFGLAHFNLPSDLGEVEYRAGLYMYLGLPPGGGRSIKGLNWAGL